MARRRRSIARALVAGLAGGLVASWTMNQFQGVWSKASEKLSANSNNGESQAKQPQNDGEDATMKAADKLSRTVAGRSLSKEQKQKAGPVVHYVFGGAMGALYGVSAELLPEVATSGFGTGFGAALFAAADEVAVPAFGLSDKPTDIPLSSHVFALMSHLVYAATTEGVRRLALAGFK